MEQWPKPEAAAAATMRQRLAVLREVGRGSQFQLFRDGQGDTVATLTAKTVPLASNPFPWWEKLPMDVSLSVRFTAAERWEKGAARRVLIDSDLWSEPSLAEAASDSYVGAMGELVRLPPRCSASCRPNRHAMANGPLPELLRDLGIETLLDDPETLHRMAEVALDRAGLAANGRAPEEYRLEVELFEWCTMRLSLLAAEDSVLHAAAPSTSRH